MSRTNTVVIVGSEPHVIIPVARALARHELRCLVVVPAGDYFPLRSNAIADVVHLVGDAADAASFLGMVLEVERAALVLPTSETALRLVSALRGRVRSTVVAAPPPGVVELVLDRAALIARASECGLSAAPPGYAGGTLGVGVLMEHQVPVLTFQQRSTPGRPDREAGTRIVESVPPDPDLVDRSIAFLRHIGWEGAALVEFGWDTDTRELCLSGMQGHLWDSIALALRAGVDFPGNIWRISQGQAAAPIAGAYPSGMRIAPHSALRSWRDPLPAVQQVARAYFERWRKRARRGAQRVVTDRVVETISTAWALEPTRRLPYLVRRMKQATAAGRMATLPAAVRSVLFVCHANVMRSPAAEHLLRSALATTPLAGIEVGSAGTHARPGHPPDQRVQRLAQELGASLEGHVSRLLDDELVNRADVIFAMDDVNVADIVSRFPGAAKKTLLLGGFAATGKYESREIPDPYFSSAEQVGATIRDIQASVEQLARALSCQHGANSSASDGTQNGPAGSAGPPVTDD